jgi:hypothetical protein
MTDTTQCTKIMLENGGFKLHLPYSQKDKTKIYPIVVPYDPAIDLDACDIVAYAGTCDSKGNQLSYGHRDINKLVFKPGSKPTLYWTRCLSMYQATEIQRQCASNPMSALQFANWGLVRIDDFVDETGKEWATWEPSEKIEDKKTGVFEIVVGSSLFKLFPGADVIEICNFVELRSFLHPKKEGRYPLPLTSKQLLDS